MNGVAHNVSVYHAAKEFNQVVDIIASQRLFEQVWGNVCWWGHMFKDGGSVLSLHNIAHASIVCEKLFRRIVKCTVVGSVALAYSFVEDIPVSVDITHECLSPALWAMPLAPFG